MNFDTHEMDILGNALHVAARKYRQDQENMVQIATAIRQGQTVPMFAEGENGVRAADRLANQFSRQVEDVEAILQRMETEADWF
jgi:hypothetical protein